MKAAEPVEIPIIIGGEEYKTGKLEEVRAPHNHKQVLARYHCAGERETKLAIEASQEAKQKWTKLPWEHRAAIFLKTAELLSGPHRASVTAATVLGQSKNFFQAEIDSACELIDFLRWNVYFAEKIYSAQPISPPTSPGNLVWNRLVYRPLEGFVYAVTPFNFTAIGGNLAATPALMGNTVVWKPSSSGAMLSNYLVMRLFEKAGLPPGVINFVPGDPEQITNAVLSDSRFAGLHYTGSTEVFKGLWKKIGDNIGNYKSYPRIVGETGGKDFIFAHKSADVPSLVTAIVRGSFEYGGQKCSACSRVYVPKSLWEGGVRDKLIEQVRKLKMGNPEEVDVLVNAVIHKKSWDNIKHYLDYVKNEGASKGLEILVGGKMDDSVGYFVEPTVVLSKEPKSRLMVNEIFGPVVTVYVYPDEQFEETLKLCDETSPFALTGSIFARDREAVHVAESILENAAGNFYINDKPTGAVVAQQPFGGGRASGTNDKAGFETNLTRWTSMRSVKETFVPATSVEYPYMSTK
eukprot:TRINITY_DN5137_c0_g2_i2.p1 TRINITY_DN5137_c0_g2~~TRINITY_DN5137_c0_g2_i2.p1  ORF type:complete len:585 (+),score=140.36 TRINITY_DN5137_c0_g2_i2:197-1756(+)